MMLANAIITNNQELFEHFKDKIQYIDEKVIKKECPFAYKIEELKNSTLEELSSYSGTRRDIFSKALKLTLAQLN